MTTTASYPLHSDPVWKPVITVLAAVVGPPAAAIAALVGAVTFSGCFIDCSGHPDHLMGALLLALAALLLLSGSLLAGLLMRRGTWVLGTVAVPFAEVGLLLLRSF